MDEDELMIGREVVEDALTALKTDEPAIDRLATALCIVAEGVLTKVLEDYDN